MDVLLPFFSKLLPVYLLVPVGYIAARYLGITKESVALLLIYFFVPAITFSNVVSAELTLSLILLPFLLALIGICISLPLYLLARLLYRDGTENIVAFAAGSSNSGFFGVPACIALLGAAAGPVAVIYNMGYILYECTYGAYMMARGKFTPLQSVKKLFKLPLVYAFLLAVAANLLHVVPPAAFMQTLDYLKGGFVPCGMMLLGMALSDVLHGERVLDGKMLGLILTGKFLLWPLANLALIALWGTFGTLDDVTQSVLLVQAVVPIAASTVAYAALFKVHPERAATAVIVSTVLSFLILPLWAIVMGLM